MGSPYYTNMKWSVDEAILLPGHFNRFDWTWLEDQLFRRTQKDTRAHRPRRRTADRRRREPPNGLGVQAVHRLRWCNLFRAGRYRSVVELPLS